jgi:hypothetical protein
VLFFLIYSALVPCLGNQTYPMYPAQMILPANVHQVALERGVVPGLYVLQCDSWGCRVIQVSLANPVRLSQSVTRI